MQHIRPNMRALPRWLVCAAIAAAALARPLRAQSSRDSAGVLIVENARPAWSDADRLSLAAKPRLIIGNATDSVYRFRQVRGVMLLSDGRIAVADAATLKLRLFSADGQFLSASAGKGNEPGQILSMHGAQRLGGDTIAIGSSFSMASLYSSAGQFVRMAAFAPRVVPPARPLMLVALLSGGAGVVAPLPSMSVTPHAIGSRWKESLSLRLATDSINAPREFGTVPYIEMEQVSSGPTSVWLSPIGVFAASDGRFYAGFGDRYEIRVYAKDAKLQTLIRRSWTPTPITDDDWEHWVVEWSKLWVQAAEREREIQRVRESPWATQNPAFSQFIVDRGGRLWVRDAHWQDAIAAGSLVDIPAVPSAWSVFDARGRWLGEVTMPTGFQPFEIGQDYVTGILRTDGMNHVAIYELGARGRKSPGGRQRSGINER